MTKADDATRRAFMLAGQLLLDVNRTSVVRSPTGLTCDELALRALAAGELTVDIERGIIRRADTGRIADRRGSNGYREVTIGSRRPQAHRVVWLAAFGPIPPGDWEINHRNRSRSDNRIRNLELVLPVGNNDHWRGRTYFLRIGLDDEGAVDPRRLAELLAGTKSQVASKRSRVITGPNAAGVAMRARTKPGRST